LGLIGDRKGVFDLLKVVKRLIDDAYPIKLTIGGNGEIRRLLGEIKNYGIAKDVQYRGWIGDKERDLILRESDIFILPSYAEGMPMAILEAMAYSVPVVSTKVGGIPELISDGETGYLINPGDLDALYKKIAYMSENLNHMISIGERGREVICAKHNIQIITQQINEIYSGL
jgi:glycosyltransferase involved in cell wall biosynthesis